MADRELEGLPALVTGASKGIGFAIAARLREQGASVLGTARTTPRDLPPGAQFVEADITTEEGCARVATAVGDAFGAVEIIVHVVGGSSAPAGGFAVLDDREWQRAFERNLFPAVRLDRALLPAMIKQGRGVIIHITSIQSRLPLSDATIAYAAAKAALAKQGALKRGWPKGRSRRARVSWLGRDRWRDAASP